MHSPLYPLLSAMLWGSRTLMMLTSRALPAVLLGFAEVGVVGVRGLDEAGESRMSDGRSGRVRRRGGRGGGRGPGTMLGGRVCRSEVPVPGTGVPGRCLLRSVG